MVKITKSMLAGSIHNGLRRYMMRQGFVGKDKDYIDAVKTAFFVSHIHNFPTKVLATQLVRKELKMVNLPVWWNVVKGKSLSVDLDEMDIFDVAEVVMLDRIIQGHIENVGEADAELIVYLDSFVSDEELLQDAEAIKNFARVFPYAYYAGLFSKKELEEMREKVLNASLQLKGVPDWVLFILSGGEQKYLRGRFEKLWNKEYWFVLF